MTAPTNEGYSKAELLESVASVPHWFHSIDLGQGVITPGDKSAELLEEELHSLRLPDLKGKSVLDIGAWDGYYSWAAERMGASRIVSLDHFVWMIDRQRADELNEQWRAQNQKPKRYEDTDAWKPGKLPGKRGYDLAHQQLNSQAECVVADFLDIDFASVGGPFDVVLFLGVLYHMRSPLRALEKVAEATYGLAVIETEAVEFNLYPELALSEFYERDELGHDYTNWWCPNERALVGMCRAAGFERVEVIKGAPQPAPKPAIQKSRTERLRRAGGNILRDLELLPPLEDEKAETLTRYRAIVHAWK
jgi:tRNA (mo5U34)-methyltransferase